MMCTALKQPFLLKLNDVRKELNVLGKGLQHGGLMLNTPTGYIEECCSLSVLQCFRENMPLLKSKNKGLQRKLTKNLRSSMIVASVNTCSEDKIKNASCLPCGSYPKRESQGFVQELKLLLQKTADRLSWREGGR